MFWVCFRFDGLLCTGRQTLQVEPMRSVASGGLQGFQTGPIFNSSVMS
jgi:hypothetical protein